MVPPHDPPPVDTAAPLASADPADPATPPALAEKTQRHNPLHGVTLEQIVNELVAHYGWQELGEQVKVNCFLHDPSIASSLKLLRRTPWARTKVESFYLFMLREKRRSGG